MRTAKVRTLDGRWRSWAPSWLASHRPSRLALPQRTGDEPNGRPPCSGVTRDDLKKRIATAALAFRGYDLTNLGRAPSSWSIALTDRSCGPSSIGHRCFAGMSWAEGRPGGPGPGS